MHVQMRISSAKLKALSFAAKVKLKAKQKEAQSSTNANGMKRSDMIQLLNNEYLPSLSSRVSFNNLDLCGNCFWSRGDPIALVNN